MNHPTKNFEKEEENYKKVPKLKNPLLNKKRKQRGFTLIEIAVVVAVIGIIIAIAVPALNSFKQDSTITAQNATSKTLNEAVSRAILKGAGGINNTNEWIAAYGTNITNAIGFLYSNSLITVEGK